MDKFLQESPQTKCELIKQNYKTDLNEELFTQVNIFKYSYYNYRSLREYLFRQLPNLLKYGITDIILESSSTWRDEEHENHLYWRIGVRGMSLVKIENPTSDECINAIQKCFDQNPAAKVAVLSKAELSDLSSRLKERNLSTTRFAFEGGDISVPDRLVKPAQIAGLQYKDFWLDLRSPKKELDASGVPKDLTQSDPGADLEAKDVWVDLEHPKEKSNAPDVLIHMKQSDPGSNWEGGRLDELDY